MLVVLCSPLFLAVGLHVGFAAYYCRKYLRVPYLAGVVVLLAAEMTAYAFMTERVSLAVLAWTFGGVLLVTVAWHGMFCQRRDLIDGCNFEYLAPGHLLFLSAAFLLPMLDRFGGQH